MTRFLAGVCFCGTLLDAAAEDFFVLAYAGMFYAAFELFGQVYIVDAEQSRINIPV